MGGSRCTYRNCSVKSDGSTHMFHYPVFDRVRCHNWLVKAQRLDFLNLKVSQLINRRVCQHHFEDKMFMNYRKDKLIHTAVPTLDGPFVTSVATSQNPNEYASDNIDYLCSIKTDDIENEISDKKAVFAEKYGSFLANCDLLELNENLCDKTSLISRNTDKINQTNYPITIHSKAQSNIIASIDVDRDINVDKKHEDIRRVTRSSKKTSGSSSSKKVKIISEKTIKDPININSKLIPVSPNHVLNPSKPANNDRSSAYQQKKLNDIQLDLPACLTQIQEYQQENVVTVETQAPASLTPVYSKDIQQEEQIRFLEIELPVYNPNETAGDLNEIQNNSLVAAKSKGMRGLRATDIENKRRFNMRLRDVVEETFHKLESSEVAQTNCDNSKSNVDVNVNSAQRTIASAANVCSQQTKGPEDLAKNLMDFMDSRLKQMENMLLLRIDNNSKQIAGLRSTVENKKVDEVKAFIRQPRQDDTSYKKGLFDEISQFLSAEAKSMIYEELFLNAFKPPTQTIAQALNQTRKRKVT